MKKKLRYPAAFLIPFVVSVVVCAANGVFPFGERSILHMDMYHQYYAFHMEFLDKLQNHGSLLYTFRQGLGADFVALYAYYLASPLNWLLILWPRAYLTEFLALSVLLKIGFCGLSFFLFAEYHFAGKQIPRRLGALYVFSAAYALSGFVAAYSWNIMWMDSIALFPLIILGLERLMREGRPGLYYVSLAVSIISNYYISVMICISLVLCFFLWFAEGGIRRVRALGQFTVYSALAGGTAAVLILPEMLILGYSGASGSSFPDKIEWYFNFLEEFSRMLAVAEPYEGTNHWPNLYAGIFTLVLVGLYFFNKQISFKKKLPRLLGVAFLLVSFANNWLDYLWHGFHFPNSLPGRQSFVFIFLMLTLALTTLSEWEGVSLPAAGFVAALVGGLLAASAYVMDYEVTGKDAFLYSAFFLIGYILLLGMHYLGQARAKRILSGALAAVALFELVINMGLTAFDTTNRTKYLAKNEPYRALIETAQNREGAFCRIEDLQRDTKNDSARYGYMSVTEFSSLMNINVSHLYQKLYLEGGLNYFAYNGATPLTSALLSVKYVLSNQLYEEHPFRTLVAEQNGTYLYENDYCLPLGYMLSEEVVTIWEEADSAKGTNVNTLAKALGATRSLIPRVECPMEIETGKTSITIDRDGYYYIAYEKCSDDNLKWESSLGRKGSFAKTKHRYLLEIGSCKKDEVISVTNKKDEEISFRIYRLNMEAMEQAYETLSAQTMTLTEFTDTSVAGTIDVTKEGRLVLSIPAERGWTLWVDGSETAIEPLRDALIGVHLEEGTHEIRLNYRTPGLVPGAVISAGCAACFVLLMLLGRRKRGAAGQIKG